MTFVLITLVLFIIIAISFYFSNIVLQPKVKEYKHTYEREVSAGKIIEKEFNCWMKEEVFIKSPDGYNLHGLFFPLEGSKKTVILVHGITWSLFSSVKYMDMFRKRGFNILIHDHRNHGMSEGSTTTYGYLEKYDLKCWADWIFNRMGSDCIIGMHGESMGAATVLQNSAIDPRISFYIADCPYSDLTDLFKIRLKEDYHLPSFPLLMVSSMICRLKGGILYGWVSPILDVSNVETPILFIHGKDDKYVPCSMSINLHEAKKKGIKELYLAPNAGHAEAYWNNKTEYDLVVEKFLRKIDVS